MGRFHLWRRCRWRLLAPIWSGVQFDFCPAVTGLTLTSPSRGAIKLVIHLRKGQSQSVAKYNPETGLTFDPWPFFQMAKVCQVTLHASLGSVSGHRGKGKAVSLSTATFSSHCNEAFVQLRWRGHKSLVQNCILKKDWADLLINRAAAKPPRALRLELVAWTHGAHMRVCVWRPGWRWGGLDYNDWHLWKRARASARTISKRINRGTVWPDCY